MRDRGQRQLGTDPFSNREQRGHNEQEPRSTIGRARQIRDRARDVPRDARANIDRGTRELTTLEINHRHGHQGSGSGQQPPRICGPRRHGYILGLGVTGSR